MPVPAPVSDPVRVGPYLISHKLGAGGMGTVYLAHHEQTGREVAIKVLAPSLAREEGLIARFMREIDAMEKLKNPHVVELFDHGVDGDLYYYAMEYVDGETVTARLRREKRIPWREVVDLSIQTCIALKAAHDAGIIHRDLKPSNLLLTRDGTIKLTDFGVAQVFAGSKLTVTGGIIGTAEYMSPEQGQGSRITKRSDLYSLGAVMYVMLTGRPPFTGKTTVDVIQKHKYGQFDRPRRIVPELPSWIDDIVCQLMEKDPEKRFADAYVVSRRLQESLRKVELSTGDVTLGEGTADSDALTLDVQSASGGRPRTGPGSGTLMRDLFRAQYESEHAPSRLRKLLENTWVLVGLLLLLIAGVGYWITHGGMSPEKRFAAGVALLDEDEQTHWETVRDQYFAPLVELKSDDWDKRLEPYLRRIRLDELRRTFAGSTRGRGRHLKRSAPNEIDRLLTLAGEQQQAGRSAQAERTLGDLAVLLGENSQYSAEREFVQESLDALRKRRTEEPPDRAFVADALARADALASEGKRDEAATIWRSVIDLYADDASRGADVRVAREKLGARAQASSKEPPPKAGR